MTYMSLCMLSAIGDFGRVEEGVGVECVTEFEEKKELDSLFQRIGPVGLFWGPLLLPAALVLIIHL